MHETMAGREKLFTMRWSEEEAAQAEAVAKHYGMPVAALVRMLIGREAATLGKSEPGDPFATKDQARRADLARLLQQIKAGGSWEFPMALDRLMLSMRADAQPEVPEMLNALRRSGYVAKVGSGYALTEKGERHAPRRGKR